MAIKLEDGDKFYYRLKNSGWVESVMSPTRAGHIEAIKAIISNSKSYCTSQLGHIGNPCVFCEQENYDGSNKRQ